MRHFPSRFRPSRSRRPAHPWLLPTLDSRFTQRPPVRHRLLPGRCSNRLQFQAGSPHEEWRAAACGPAWNLLGASVRGKLHAHQAQWRDDAFAWQQAGDWTCIAVADGAGSAPLSRVGSRAWRAASVCWPQPWPAGIPLARNRWRARLRTIFATCAACWSRRRPDQPLWRGRAASAMPLSCCSSTPRLAMRIVDQIGDGAWGCIPLTTRCIVLGQADHGVLPAETPAPDHSASRTIWRVEPPFPSSGACAASPS